jgi:hypothetical protein
MGGVAAGGGGAEKVEMEVERRRGRAPDFISGERYRWIRSRQPATGKFWSFHRGVFPNTSCDFGRTGIIVMEINRGYGCPCSHPCFLGSDDSW